jgi:CRISPR type IV-associated protein Csf3
MPDDYGEVFRRLDAYRPPKGAYRPLKVVFTLATPVSQGYPWVRGDALLAAALMREVLGDLMYSLPNKRVLPCDEHLVLPLTRSYEDVVPGGIWHASASVLDTDLKRVTRQYKRFDVENTDVLSDKVKKKKIEMNMGYYKAGLTSLAYAPARQLIFYFHGHEEEVRRILSAVPFIGKNRSSGYGEVRSLTVEEISEDRSLISDSVVMRPLPLECVPRARLDQCAQLTYGLPAWDHSRAVACVPPGTVIA